MVHQYKLNGYNVVIDVYSGAIHVVDDVAYDIIRLFCEKDGNHPDPEEVRREILDRARSGEYDEYNESVKACDNPKSFEEEFINEVSECYDDVCGLIEAGKLFSKDIFRPNAKMLKERHTDIKALCLHVSHACDLTCSYCFAGQGRFNGPAALMDIDIAKRAIDFLVENSGDRRNLEVDFFGGEPLLNFDVVKETVSYARSIEKDAGKNFRFTLTTNGMGINDDVIDFVNKECYNVVLSLDGRKEIHDRERRAAGSTIDGVNIARGSGSYDIVVPKFRRLVESRTANKENSNYYIRGTFTHYNPDFTEDIYHMTELGFTELSMEPVVCDKESRFALTEEDFPMLLEQYEKLAIEMLQRNRARSKEPGKQPFTFYHYMIDMGHGPCIYKRISGCGSGTEYFAVTPEGKLYPCHQFVGDEKYEMGDIWQGIYSEKKPGQEKAGVEIRDEFKACNVYARKECDDCWAKLYCSGGCAANAYHATGSILGVYDYGCKLFKKRIECALMLKIAENDSDQ